MRELFSETEYFIKEFRGTIPASTQTARSIDRNDSWARIAFFAEQEGFVSFATYLTNAQLAWSQQTKHGAFGL